MINFFTKWFALNEPSSVSPGSSDRHQSHPTLEALEEREVPSAYIASSGRLIVEGTAYSDRIYLDNITKNYVPYYRVTINGQVSDFRVTSVSSQYRPYVWGYGGNDTIVNRLNRSVLADGGTGNDSLYAGNYADVLYGGDNNDLLIGGRGNDNLSGNNGFDRLEGRDGNDVLYGGDNNDRLLGGNGVDSLLGGYHNDMLFGGGGQDYMDGQWGADRLLRNDSDTIANFNSVEDARLAFTYGNKSWTESEILQVDEGFRLLHEATNNTRMLKLKSGGYLSFQRFSVLGNNYLADNNSAGLIRVANAAFTASIPIRITIVHEIGHNWDDENPNWVAWKNLSSWRDLPVTSVVPVGYTRARNLQGVAQPYIYRSTATFARTYGHTNPREDFCTCMEIYFSGAAHTAIQAKWNFIDTFIKSMRT